MTATNRQVVSVSELTRDARDLLEGGFPSLFVEGEISNMATPASGHWYFTLKDERAQVRCAMFRNRNQAVQFKPKDGQQVVVGGRVSLYEARGEFQLIADSLEDSGEGALRRAFEQLRDSLQKEGLFAEDRKQPIPEMPQHIAIVTSPTGAAIRDVITVMRRRFRGIRITLLPVQVQGDEAPPQIVEAIERANLHERDPFDLILITRGGGSLEDLWAFNTEPVARAITASQLPVVSAVGHESDVTIADFVADLRAATPSAAAELITPDGEVLLAMLQGAEQQLAATMLQQLGLHAREVRHLRRRLRHPERYLQELQQRADELQRRILVQGRRQLEGFRFDEQRRRLTIAMNRKLNTEVARVAAVRLVPPTAQVRRIAGQLYGDQQDLQRLMQAKSNRVQAALNLLAEKLDALSPLATLQRGYAIVTDDADNIVTASSQLEPGQRIKARLSEGEVAARVLDN